MSQSPPSLESVLQRLRDLHRDLVRDTREEQDRSTLDEMLERLSHEVLEEEDGSVVLADGSRLYVSTEHGDRGGETGRIAAIQRFPDDRPERIHLIAD